MIRLEGVTVAFGHTVALDRLELELEPGIVGLYGPNGSGKSTLLRALAGLLRPTRGAVVVGGRAVSAQDEDWRARVGYLGHGSGLYGRLTLRENLALFARLHGARRERVEHVLEELALTERAGARVEALSAGLKRRAGVARALVAEPEVLLLDEPYANLHEDASAIVTGAVLAWRRPGRIAVIATHGAKRLKPHADAGLVLQRGRAASFRPRVAEAAAP